jgi:hypothetical protein
MAKHGTNGTNGHNGSNGHSIGTSHRRGRHFHTVRPAPGERMLMAAATAQGGYFVVTGLWPLVHMPSFELVTGRKREDWLVKTVGGVVAVIGGVLLDGARKRRVDRTAATLAIGSAAVLAGVDITYVVRRRISPVYLLDAALELGFMGLWAAGLSARRHRAW